MLTSADFADGIDTQLLTNLTGGTSSPDEDAITACSTKAWDEMWTFLRQRYSEPATCPEGQCKALLLTVTTYHLYGRRKELLANPEGMEVTRERKEALALCEKAARGDASIKGLTLLDADTLEANGDGLVYSANDPVWTKTTYRGC